MMQDALERNFSDPKNYRSLKLALRLENAASRAQAAHELAQLLQHGRLEKFCTVVRSHILSGMPVADAHELLRMVARNNPLYGARLELFGDRSNPEFIRGVAVTSFGQQITLMNQIREGAVAIDPYKPGSYSTGTHKPTGERIRPMPNFAGRTI